MVEKTRLKRGKNLRRQRGGLLFSTKKSLNDESGYIYKAGNLKKQDIEKFQEIFEKCGAIFGDETPPVDSATGKNLNNLITQFIINNKKGEYDIDIPSEKDKFICEAYKEDESPPVTPNSSPDSSPRTGPGPGPGPGPRQPIIPPREPTTEEPEPKPKPKPEPKPKPKPKPKGNLLCLSCGRSSGSKKYKKKKSKRKSKKSKRKHKKKSKKTKRK